MVFDIKPKGHEEAGKKAAQRTGKGRNIYGKIGGPAKVPGKKTTRHKQKAKSKLMSARPKKLKEIVVEGISIYTDDPGRLSRLFRKRLGGELKSKSKVIRTKKRPSKSKQVRKRLGGY